MTVDRILESVSPMCDRCGRRFSHISFGTALWWTSIRVTYLIGSLRYVCKKKTLNQTVAPQFPASLKGNRPSLHTEQVFKTDETVNISRKQQRRPVFWIWLRCDICMLSLIYVFFYPVVTKILIFLSRFFLWFLLLVVSALWVCFVVFCFSFSSHP